MPLVRVPIGRKYTVTATGSLIKQVCCEKCNYEYQYKVQRIGTGYGTSLLWLDNDGASQRANRNASSDLDKKLARAIEPIPCPSCRWYQRNMISIVKLREAKNTLLFGLLTAFVIFLVSSLGASVFKKLAPLFSILIQISVLLVPFSFITASVWYILFNPNKDIPLGKLIRYKFISFKNKFKYKNSIVVNCSSCGQKIRFPNKENIKISCPKCKSTFINTL